MTMMLIGNKSDLAQKDRKVTSEDACAYAEKEGMSFLETSALDATNVAMAFEAIIKGKYYKDRLGFLKWYSHVFFV